MVGCIEGHSGMQKHLRGFLQTPQIKEVTTFQTGNRKLTIAHLMRELYMTIIFIEVLKYHIWRQNYCHSTFDKRIAHHNGFHGGLKISHIWRQNYCHANDTTCLREMVGLATT
jgi:hypothetical protein